VQVASDVKGAIAKGDTCLLVFFARAVEGTASGAASVEVRRPPEYPKLGNTQFQVKTKWQPVILPFVAPDDGPDGQCAVSIHLGGNVQKVDIGGLRLLNYGPDFPVQKLPQPRFTYEGREPDAAWRVEALKRIEKHRKGDFSFSLVNQDDSPAAQLPIEITLKRHAFGFGSAVTAKWMADHHRTASATVPSWTIASAESFLKTT
jgi:endo-1,4-beta-xylanase